MISKAFWGKVASEWKKADDGISIPQGDSRGAERIIHEDDTLESIRDDEIDDILKDFDFDD